MARTDNFWTTVAGGSYLKTIFSNGIDILINGTNRYLNFNSISGTSGYGIRDNAGVMEYKDSGGSWVAFSASGGGTWGSITGLLSDQVDLNTALNNRVLKAGDTMTGALIINGSVDTKQLQIKAHSTQINPLVELLNNAGDSVITMDKNGTIKVRNRVTGSDGRIELTTGVNPSVDIIGDPTNGYFPAINFVQAGIPTGQISGYGGILFAPAAGYSAGAWSYYVNSKAFYAKSGYGGIHSVPLFEIMGYQGANNPLGFWQDGSIKQYGSTGNINHPIAVPVAVSAVASGSGSSLAAGTYYYKVSACNFVGETIASNEVSVTILAGQNVVISWTQPNYAGVDHFRVYRATSAGGYTATSRISPMPIGTPYYLNSLTDTGQAATSGSPLSTLSYKQQVFRRWAGQSGDFIDFQNEAGTSLAGVKYDGNIEVPDEAYDASAWDGSLEVPTKNAIRDKIESLPTGGGVSLTEVEIDFGTIGTPVTSWTITDAGVASSNKILVFPSPNPATGRAGNDWELDSAIFTAIAGTGNFVVNMVNECLMIGKRKIYYQKI